MGLGQQTKMDSDERKRMVNQDDQRPEAIDNTAHVRAELQDQKKVKIIIASTETQRDDVQVGINGYVFNIKRDVEVIVPEAVVEVLRNARLTTYTQRKREDGEGMELVPQTSPRFAFQAIG